MIKLFLVTFLMGQLLFARAQGSSTSFPLIRDLYTSWEKDRPFTYKTCDTFFYADKMDTLVIDKIKTCFVTDRDFTRWTPYEDTANKDKIKFTLEERNYIIGQLDQLKQNTWQFHMFPHSQVVPVTSIGPLLEKTDTGNSSPGKKICKEIHTFSKPFFLRNNTLCFFYVGKNNIFTKEGECWIYRKEQETWKKYAPVYQWAGFD
ncbi:MAG: hypothetical protein NVSMB63_00830 [Sediminibacterium sp.]